MRSIAEIQTMSTTTEGKKKTHQSCLRAYQILERAKDWLKRGTPNDVVLELIYELESYDVEFKRHKGTLKFTAVEEVKE